MNKKIFLSALAVLALAVPANALECGAAAGFNFGDAFDLMDVNGDGFVSANEYAGLVDAADQTSLLTDAQKQAKKKRLEQAFKKFDADKDDRLEKEEFIRLMTAETQFAMKDQMEQMKKFAEDPDYAEKQLQDAMEKLNQTMEKVKSMPAEEMADNFLANISNGIAGENFFQMDKDKNGCVTETEYAVYMAEYTKKTADGFQFQMSEQDFRQMYRDEKKAKPDCLTKDEYIRNFNEQATAPDDIDIDALLAETGGD